MSLQKYWRLLGLQLKSDHHKTALDRVLSESTWDTKARDLDDLRQMPTAHAQGQDSRTRD